MDDYDLKDKFGITLQENNKNQLFDELSKIKERQVQSDCFPHCCDDHICADMLLLAYINDEKITKIFKEIEKWYS